MIRNEKRGNQSPFFYYLIWKLIRRFGGGGGHRLAADCFGDKLLAIFGGGEAFDHATDGETPSR